MKHAILWQLLHASCVSCELLSTSCACVFSCTSVINTVLLQLPPSSRCTALRLCPAVNTGPLELTAMLREVRRIHSTVCLSLICTDEVC